MIVVFVEFIDQLIDYPINRASLTRYTVCLLCLMLSCCDASIVLLVSPSVGASGELCFVIVTFPRYLHIYFFLSRFRFRFPSMLCFLCAYFSFHSRTDNYIAYDKELSSEQLHLIIISCRSFF